MRGWNLKQKTFKLNLFLLPLMLSSTFYTLCIGVIYSKYYAYLLVLLHIMLWFSILRSARRIHRNEQEFIEFRNKS